VNIRQHYKRYLRLAVYPDPELSAGVFLSPMELVSGNQVADLRLMQMFPWFGVIKNAKDEMSLMAKAKFELFHDVKAYRFFTMFSVTGMTYIKFRRKSVFQKRILKFLKIIERLAMVKFKAAPSDGSGSASSSQKVSSGSAQNSIAGSSGMQPMGSVQSNSGSSVQNQASASMQTGSDEYIFGQVRGLTDIYRIQIETGDLENNIALTEKSKEHSIIAKFNTYLNRSVTSPVYTYENITRDSLELCMNRCFR
jgi:hypothetical protein